MDEKEVDEKLSGGKAERIKEACQIRDLEALIDLATSEHGLIDDEHRRAACELTRSTKFICSPDNFQGPILLGCQEQEVKEEKPWKELPAHSDEGQVKLDVDRAFVYYPRSEPLPCMVF